MKTAILELAQIHCDSGTQSRLGINEETVSEYAERLAAGDKFPPMDVFMDGTDYHMADGFHRYMAATRNRVLKFPCNIHSGTASDALWFALGANRVNGLRMSSSDKRRSIELALAKFPDKTQEAIAAHVGCSRGRVTQVSAELVNANKLTLPTTRKGKDGKERKTTYEKRDTAKAEPVADPGHEPSPAPAPEDDEDKPFVHSADEPEDKAFSTKVEKAFHKMMEKYAAAEMPAARNVIRAILAKSEKHDGYNK